MTIAEHWSQQQTDGRALLLAYEWGEHRVWIAKLGDAFVRCDDSDSGHLEAVDGQAEVAHVLDRWQKERGVYRASHARARRHEAVGPLPTTGRPRLRRFFPNSPRKRAMVSM
jgi:hypothetical protein